MFLVTPIANYFRRRAARKADVQRQLDSNQALNDYEADELLEHVNRWSEPKQEVRS